MLLLPRLLLRCRQGRVTLVFSHVGGGGADAVRQDCLETAMNSGCTCFASSPNKSMTRAMFCNSVVHRLAVVVDQHEWPALTAAH
ncbi:MAG TPA: hypothetical protein VK558_17195 [Patescibacteria group bacterium]|nr:hypothetical protein [Patescibacteria group bacterium]